MSQPEHGATAAALRAALATADRAAHGTSNDAELDALRHALDLALTRWPEMHDAASTVDRPADVDEPAPGAGRSQPTAAAAHTAPSTGAALVTLPHTGIRVPDPELRVSSLQQLPTPHGLAYTATVRLGRTLVGTVHHDGTGGLATYYPAAGSPFGQRRLAAFADASRTADDQPISEDALLEELITEYEHATAVTEAIRHGRSPLRLRVPLGKAEHLAGVYDTARHATAATVTTAAQRAALAARLGRTAGETGQWWQLWTGQRWEDLTPAPPRTPGQGHR